MSFLYPPPACPALTPGNIILLHGPSGCGKTRLLRLWRQSHCDLSWVKAPAPLCRDATVLQSLRPLEPQDAAHLLCLVGLIDSHLWQRPVATLCRSQRWRLRLARSLSRPPRGPTVLLIDDFAQPLDDLSAWSLARSLRRRLSANPACAMVLASHRLWLAEPLAAISVGLAS